MVAESSLVRNICARVIALILLVTALGFHVVSPVRADEPATTAFSPVAATTLADTRVEGGFTQLSANAIRVPVAGVGPVATDARAAVLSLTVLGSVAPGYLTVWPTGSARPDTSAMNFERNQRTTSSLVIQLGDTGAVDIAASTGATIVVEVVGAFTPAVVARAGRLVPTVAHRLLDTRVNNRPLPARGKVQVPFGVTVPGDAIAAVITVSTDRANRPGDISVTSVGSPAPSTPALVTAVANTTASATVIVPLTTSAVAVSSSGGGHVVVDLVAYFTGASAAPQTTGMFLPSQPQRMIDTRDSRRLQPGGVAIVATNAVVVGTLTMTDATDRGFVTTFPSGDRLTGTYHLGVARPNQTVSNMTIANTSADGFGIASEGGGHVIFDRTGSFVTAAAPLNTCTVSDLLVPECGAWFGASTPSMDGSYNYPVGLDEYERVALTTPDILHFYKRGDKPFPTASEIEQSQRPGRQRSILMYNWKPSVTQTWRQIADGAADAAIESVSAGLKTYPHKLFLAIHHEPENDEGPEGWGMTAADYVAMYRHVVATLRAEGVTNVVFVMNYIGYKRFATAVDRFYPGDDVVDWLAYDAYGFREETDFAKLLNSPAPGWEGFYNWATVKAPGKPIMLAEWGFDLRVQPFAPDIIGQAPGVLEQQFPMVKALVYWNSETNKVQVRIDLAHALGRAYGAAYARLAADPYFNATSTTAAP